MGWGGGVGVSGVSKLPKRKPIGPIGNSKVGGGYYYHGGNPVCPSPFIEKRKKLHTPALIVD